MPKTSGKSGKSRQTGDAEKHPRDMDDAEKHPRDMDTEDRGVPRGDWNDEPQQEDEGRPGVRSNFDAHLNQKGSKARR